MVDQEETGERRKEEVNLGMRGRIEERMQKEAKRKVKKMEKGGNKNLRGRGKNKEGRKKEGDKGGGLLNSVHF